MFELAAGKLLDGGHGLYSCGGAQFLVACTRLYKPLSVGRSVGLSETDYSEHATYGDRPCSLFPSLLVTHRHCIRVNATKSICSFILFICSSILVIYSFTFIHLLSSSFLVPSVPSLPLRSLVNARCFNRRSIFPLVGPFIW